MAVKKHLDRAKGAVISGAAFEKKLKDKFKFAKLPIPTPDMARRSKGRSVVVEAKFSAGVDDRVVIDLEQIQKLKNSAKQKDIYGKLLKPYLALGFGQRTYFVPLASLLKLMRGKRVQTTRWKLRGKAKERLDRLEKDRERLPSIYQEGREHILGKYGRAYIRLSRKEVQGIAERFR